MKMIGDIVFYTDVQLTDGAELVSVWPAIVTAIDLKSKSHEVSLTIFPPGEAPLAFYGIEFSHKPAGDNGSHGKWSKKAILKT